jgi:hypothetical protein
VLVSSSACVWRNPLNPDKFVLIIERRQLSKYKGKKDDVEVSKFPERHLYTYPCCVSV